MKLFRKMFTIINKSLDKVIDTLKEETIQTKKKVYNKDIDTTTTYVKTKKKGKVAEEITVNGRKVNPTSTEGKKIKAKFNKDQEKIEEVFTAMDKTFEQMGNMFDKMGEMFDKL